MRLPFAAVATALFVVHPALAEDAARIVDSRIARVTVYEDRALVTRTARPGLPQGVTRLVFEHLPASLDDASIRARCGAARVLGVDRATVHLVVESREEMLKARAAHDAARRKLTAAEMELAE